MKPSQTEVGGVLYKDLIQVSTRLIECLWRPEPSESSWVGELDMWLRQMYEMSHEALGIDNGSGLREG